ncbi:MAG: hypothetical protein ACI9DC_002146 [Gammaproteobacteria bacterium]|jgi:hypothetical protein
MLYLDFVEVSRMLRCGTDTGLRAGSWLTSSSLASLAANQIFFLAWAGAGLSRQVRTRSYLLAF